MGAMLFYHFSCGLWFVKIMMLLSEGNMKNILGYNPSEDDNYRFGLHEHYAKAKKLRQIQSDSLYDQLLYMTILDIVGPFDPGNCRMSELVFAGW